VTAAATTCPTAAAPVAVTDYAYDDLDRLMRVTENLTAGEGGNRVTETVYNADGSVHQVKRAVGTARHWHKPTPPPPTAPTACRSR
jgi:hypothetical protein